MAEALSASRSAAGAVFAEMRGVQMRYDLCTPPSDAPVPKSHAQGLSRVRRQEQKRIKAPLLVMPWNRESL